MEVIEDWEGHESAWACLDHEEECTHARERARRSFIANLRRFSLWQTADRPILLCSDLEKKLGLVKVKSVTASLAEMSSHLS